MTDDAMDPDLAERLRRLASWEPSDADSADASDADAVVAGAERRRRRRGMGVGVAAAVALIGATSVMMQLDKQADTVVVAGDRPDEQTGFAAWGPGWHVLDTGPVPAMSDASIEWTGDELLVVGDGQAFTFSPVSRRWTERDAPPLTVRGMAMADAMLVAVGEGPEPTPEEYQQGAQAAPTAATFDPATHEWSDSVSVPANEALRAQSTGIRDSFFEPALAWNGSHLFDLGRGAVFDPGASVWSALAMPDDLPAYVHLLSGQLAAIDGAVELVSASVGPGLRWNRDGSAFEENPGLPPELSPATIGATSGADTRDGLVVVDIDSGSEPRRAVTYDGAYRSIPPPNEPPSRGCPQIATAAGRAVAFPCDPVGTFHELVDGAWQPIGPAPLSARCCGAAATDTGDALVVWSTSTDTANDPGNAPYVGAAVWVPGGPTPRSRTGS